MKSTKKSTKHTRLCFRVHRTKMARGLQLHEASCSLPLQSPLQHLHRNQRDQTAPSQSQSNTAAEGGIANAGTENAGKIITLSEFVRSSVISILPIKQRIEFKLCLLVHKSLIGHSPAYISNLRAVAISSCHG